MSVREYIGARYIPMFADPIEWDITSIYEPLTVVQYQGGSYVSRREVPAGIALDNTDYWILWADFNAQLQHYIDVVNAFDGRIDNIEDKFPIDTTDIADDAITSAKIDDGAVGTSAIASSAVTSAKIADDAITSAKIDDGAVGTSAIASSAVTSAKIADDAITADKIASNAVGSSEISNGAITPQKIANGEMVVIGDSYSALSNNTREQSWWYLVSQILNLNPHCYAVNGTAFVKTTPSPNFQAQLVQAKEDSSFNNNDVTYVFIYGGYNDCYNVAGVSGSAIWSAVRDCLIYAKNNFPNAYIVIAGCNTNKNIYPQSSSNWSQMIYAQLMANAVNTQYGATFIDLTQLFVGEEDFIDSVTDHPNIDGQKAIAQAMLNGLYGMNPYTNMHTLIDITSQVTNGSASYVALVKHQGQWGMVGTGIRAGSNGMFTVSIPYNLYQMFPDNIPCICDSATGQVYYGAILTDNPPRLNAFANQNANCFITWNIDIKNAYRQTGASHNYTY